MLIENVKNQFEKAKIWTENNRDLAIGAAAIGGLATFVSLMAIIPAWKARKANRAGRYKRVGRFMRRAAEEYNGLEMDLDGEDFMGFLVGLVENLDND